LQLEGCLDLIVPGAGASAHALREQRPRGEAAARMVVDRQPHPPPSPAPKGAPRPRPQSAVPMSSPWTSQQGGAAEAAVAERSTPQQPEQLTLAQRPADVPPDWEDPIRTRVALTPAPQFSTLPRLMSQVQHDAAKFFAKRDGMPTVGVDACGAGVLSEAMAGMLTRAMLLVHRPIPQGELSALVQRAAFRSFRPGDVLVKEGEGCECMYIVASGKCCRAQLSNYTMDPSSPPSGQENTVGLYELLHSTPSPVTVRAVVPTTAAVVQRDDLLECLAEATVDSMRLSMRAELLRELPVFKELTRQQACRIASRLRARRLRPGETLMRLDTCDQLAVVEAGCLVARSPDGRFVRPESHDVGAAGGTIHPHGHVGMRAVLHGSQVGVEVTAAAGPAGGAAVLLLDSAELEAVLDEEAASECMLEYMRAGLVKHLLRHWPLLAGLSSVALSRVYSCGERITYRALQVILEEGDAVCDVFVLERGTLGRVKRRAGSAGSQTLGTLSLPGTIVGQEVVTGQRAQATCAIVARTECTLYRIPRGALPRPGVAR